MVVRRWVGLVRRWATTGPRRIAAGAIAAALLLGVVGASWWAFARSPEGPLQLTANATLNGVNLPVGGDATWGDLTIPNTTDRDIVLKQLALVEGRPGSTSGVDVEGVQAVDGADLSGPGIGMAQGTGDTVIAQDLRRPMAGYILRPGHTVILLVHFRVAHAGVWRFDFGEITYGANGSTYRLKLPQALGVCSPPRQDCQVGTPAAMRSD